MDPFLEKLSAGLEGLARKTKALVGVSGGRDSMTLLNGLLILGYRKLVICHLNHQIGATVDRMDENFVARQARQKNLPFESKRVDLQRFAADHKISLETAGRELRYAFYTEVARHTRCSLILLGHHADDQLETCWLNFLRGTGIAGLAGMRRESLYQIKGRRPLRVWRPLLKVPHSEIVRFAQDRHLPFREDLSNSDISFTRNRIRHELLPFIDRKFGTAHRDAVLRCAEILADEEDWMKALAQEFPCKQQMPYKDLLHLPLALQRRVLRRWLLQAGVPGVGFVEVERVRSLLLDRPGLRRPAKVNLPAGIHARRRAGMLFLE